MAIDLLTCENSVGTPLLRRYDGISVATIKSSHTAPINSYDLTQLRDGNIFVAQNFFGERVMKFSSDFSSFASFGEDPILRGFTGGIRGLTSNRFDADDYWVCDIDGNMEKYKGDTGAYVSGFAWDKLPNTGGPTWHGMGYRSLSGPNPPGFPSFYSARSDDLIYEHTPLIGASLQSLAWNNARGVSYHTNNGWLIICFTFMSATFINIWAGFSVSPGNLLHSFVVPDDTWGVCIFEYTPLASSLTPGHLSLLADSISSITAEQEASSSLEFDPNSLSTISEDSISSDVISFDVSSRESMSMMAESY